MNNIQIVVLLLAAIANNPASAQSPETPEYTAIPCCQLCPEAANSRNYQDPYLKANYQIIQGKNDWLFRSESDLRTDYGPKNESFAMISTFLKTIEMRGSQVVLVYIPSRGLMHSKQINGWPFNFSLALHNYRAALQSFRNIGFIVPPLDTLIGQLDSSSENFFFKRDSHWTPWGAQKTAELIASTLAVQPFYLQLQNQAFTTRLHGLVTQSGTMQNAVSRLCHGDLFPSEYMQQYVTETAIEHTDSLLSSATKQPEIVLLGSGFSAHPHFNFSGFLKQAMGKDVLNMAIRGNEERDAWMEYLASESYQKHPPRLIIWEMSSQYNIADKSFFRQLIPLIYDGCKKQPVLMEKSQSLNQGKATDLVFSTQLLKTKANDLVMDMNISDPTVHTLQVRIWYQDGSDELFSVKQNKRAQTSGRFVFLLSQDEKRRNSKFLSMDVTHTDGIQQVVTINTRVCSQSIVLGEQTAQGEGYASK